MGSQVILDSPQLLEETLVTLREACRLFPIPISRPACERYVRHGSRGVVLESVLVCGKRMSSIEAINRFVRAQLCVEPAPAQPKLKGNMSKKELDAKSHKYNLPESQGSR